MIIARGLPIAHAVPDGYSADEWMDVVQAMMPEVLGAGSVTALDIFVESIAFSNDHLATMGELAAAAGLALRCHVEQFGGYRSVPVARSVSVSIGPAAPASALRAWRGAT